MDLFVVRQGRDVNSFNENDLVPAQQVVSLVTTQDLQQALPTLHISEVTAQVSCVSMHSLILIHM